MHTERDENIQEHTHENTTHRHRRSEPWQVLPRKSVFEFAGAQSKLIVKPGGQLYQRKLCFDSDGALELKWEPGPLMNQELSTIS